MKTPRVLFSLCSFHLNKMPLLAHAFLLFAVGLMFFSVRRAVVFDRENASRLTLHPHAMAFTMLLFCCILFGMLVFADMRGMRTFPLRVKVQRIPEGEFLLTRPFSRMGAYFGSVVLYFVPVLLVLLAFEVCFFPGFEIAKWCALCTVLCATAVQFFFFLPVPCRAVLVFGSLTLLAPAVAYLSRCSFGRATYGLFIHHEWAFYGGAALAILLTQWLIARQIRRTELS